MRKGTRDVRKGTRKKGDRRLEKVDRRSEKGDIRPSDVGLDGMVLWRHIPKNLALLI